LLHATSLIHVTNVVGIADDCQSKFKIGRTRLAVSLIWHYDYCVGIGHWPLKLSSTGCFGIDLILNRSIIGSRQTELPHPAPKMLRFEFMP
jgi:hypothetical protein